MRWIVKGALAALLALPVFCADGQSPQAAAADSLFATSEVRSPASATLSDRPQPPVAAQRPKVLEDYGRQRIDNYYWLRDGKDPDVIAYLQAENAYAEAMLAPLKPLAAKLHSELMASLGGADPGVPFVNGGYIYQLRYDKDADYPLIERRKTAPDAPTETVLDVAKLAAGHSEFFLNNWIVSPNGGLIAYAVDFSGNNKNTIFIRSIATGQIIDDAIKGAEKDIVFSADGHFLFYRTDASVWRHAIGTDKESDVLVYREKDNTFELTLSLTKSRKFILITADHTDTTEVLYLEAVTPTERFRVIEPRRPKVRYYLDHVGDKFFILTNRRAPDFEIDIAPQATPDAAHWKALVGETPGHYIAKIEVFERYLALEEIHDANSFLRVIRLADMHDIAVERPSKIGEASIDANLNREDSSNRLLYAFEAPLQPKTVYELDMATGATTQRHQALPAERFDPKKYSAKQIYARAADGTLIPITIVYRPDLLRSGGNPAIITGYGAYGHSSLPGFPASWYPLIDRGFVYAIAHVRGGREMGQIWYEEGRLLNKKNTFTDFIAAAEALIAQGYADRRNIFAQGASAGGLLMGALANMRPDLYAGIVAKVPFVDLMTTMSDPTVPLTTFEYEEWGNPAIEEQYDYMLSYAPYDNLAAKNYPPMFVTAGFYDRQVGYFEPAKWVAKLRATKTDGNQLLFVTNMDAGHHGDSGRLRRLRQQAIMMAWLLARAHERF